MALYTKNITFSKIKILKKITYKKKLHAGCDSGTEIFCKGYTITNYFACITHNVGRNIYQQNYADIFISIFF